MRLGVKLATMFTGIVQARGRLAAIEDRPFGKRLIVDTFNWHPPGGYRPAPGESICISGVCLTVVVFDDHTLHFDVITETLAKSKLGDLKAGDEVNIEPSVTPNQPLGGHFMQGHVDSVGVISKVVAEQAEWRLTIEPTRPLMDCIIAKGSVAIDGVSLTIAEVGASDFEVALIPTTLELTTLGGAAVGQRVNLEGDIIAKTIVTYLKRQSQQGEAITLASLQQAGFVDTASN